LRGRGRDAPTRAAFHGAHPRLRAAARNTDRRDVRSTMRDYARGAGSPIVEACKSPRSAGRHLDSFSANEPSVESKRPPPRSLGPSPPGQPRPRVEGRRLDRAMNRDARTIARCTRRVAPVPRSLGRSTVRRSGGGVAKHRPRRATEDRATSSPSRSAAGSWSEWSRANHKFSGDQRPRGAQVG